MNDQLEPIADSSDTAGAAGPMSFTRRTLLGGTGIAAVGSAFAAPALLGPAVAAPTAPEGEMVPILEGTASQTAAINGNAFHDGVLYVGSRTAPSPGTPRLAAFDPLAEELLWVQDLELGSSSGITQIAADDDHLYIGASGHTHLFRQDRATGETEQWLQLGGASTIPYSMRLEGEHLWIGTYPDCRLRRITVASGEILDFGRIGASTYMVGIALDEDHVYASTAAPGELKVFDHQANLLHDLTEHLVESPVGTLKVIAHEGLLYVSVGRAVLSMRPDGTERVERPIPDEDRYVDHFDITPDGRLIALARNTTNYYEVTPDGLEHLGAPSSDLQNVGFTILEDGTLVGVSGIGHIWTTPLGGEASIFSTAETDFGYPETVQSVLAHSSSSVWVGGHFALTKHSPSPRPRGRLIDPDRYRPGRIPTQRLDVNGEPKSLLEIDDGTVLAGLYPSTDVIAVHPDTLEIRTLGTIGHEQMRPMAMAWDADRRTALVATTASQQIHTGALTFVDVESGDMDVRNFLPGQNTRALTVDGDFAYLAGDVYAEGTGEHPLEVASVAEIDLRTREVTRIFEPREWASLESVVVLDRILYVMSRRPSGHWYALDLETEEVVASGEMGGYGTLAVHLGTVYTWDKWTDSIQALTLEDGGGRRTVYEHVPDGWFNNPDFGFVRRIRGAWGAHGTDLAWFPLT